MLEHQLFNSHSQSIRRENKTKKTKARDIDLEWIQKTLRFSHSNQIHLFSQPIYPNQALRMPLRRS
jgi:hypothetical protein